MEGYVFVLMLKEKSFMAPAPIILTAVDKDNIKFLYDVADKNAEKFEDEYDVICYTFKKGRITEISVYDLNSKDFNIISRIEE